MGGGGPSLAVGAAFALAAAAAAQPFPPTPPDQRRHVAGWTVEHAAESDGGRIVRLFRRHGRLRLEYRAVFWRGNHGIYMDTSVHQGDLTCAEDWRQEWRTAAPAEAVRSRFAFNLADCGRAPGEAARALHGFDPAYRLAAQWVAEAEALTEAEIQTIVDYPNRDPQ